MSNELIDPLFNNSYADRKKVLAFVQPSNTLVSASEKPPMSPNSRKPMTLVEGAYNGKAFKMWVDVDNRLAIPVRKD